MNDAAPMRFTHRLAYLQHERRQHRERKGSVRRQQRCEVVAFQIFHDDERIARRRDIHIEHMDNMIAREPRGGSRFALKPRHHLRSGVCIGAHDLEGDLATELAMRRGKHNPHATFAEDALHFVLAGDDVARLHA